MIFNKCLLADIQYLQLCYIDRVRIILSTENNTLSGSLAVFHWQTMELANFMVAKVINFVADNVL